MKSNLHSIRKYGLTLYYDFENNKIICPLLKDIKKDSSYPNTLSPNENLCQDQQILYFKTSDYLGQVHSRTDKITLMINQDCNLNCKYCYGGESGRYTGSKSKMNIETLKESVNFLEKRALNAEKYYINFFGGEPLMSYSLIKEFVLYLNNKNKETSYQYLMTSNGTLITKEIATFLKDNNFNLTISLDGPELINDENRVFRNGRGSFNRVIKGINYLKSLDVPFILRATLSTNRINQYNEILEFLKTIKYSPEPQITLLSNYNDDDISYFPLTEFESYFSVLDKITETKIADFYNKSEPDLPKGIVFGIRKLHHLPKSLNGCDFMRGTTAVNTNGDLFPCHRFVGLENFCFGNVYTGIDPERFKSLCDRLDKATHNCNYCFAKYICARACIRDIAKRNGSFITFPESYCANIREHTERIICNYFLLKKYNLNYFKKIVDA